MRQFTLRKLLSELNLKGLKWQEEVSGDTANGLLQKCWDSWERFVAFIETTILQTKSSTWN